MKALVISKPIYDYILPLVEFPLDGDKFYIENSIRTISNIGAIVSIVMAKYGIDTSYTGVVGEDDIGGKIKEILNNNKVDTTYIETNYEGHTSINHKIYNSKTNKFTTINENSIKQGLLKYKYEFIPDVVIMDDGDYNANMAAINNYPESNLIYISEKYSKTSSVYCNKCKYVICNLKFASEATGILNNLNKPKVLVSLFQKYIDLYNSNLIIKLDNFDVMYCVNDEVRLIKNVNNNLNNKDNIYYALLTYYLINTNDIENSIKLTNKAMLLSKNELDMINNVPEYKEVINILEEYKSNIVNTQNSVESNQNNNSQTINNTINTNINNTIPKKDPVVNNVNIKPNNVNVDNNINKNIETVNDSQNSNVNNNSTPDIATNNIETPITNNEIKGDNK